MALSTTSLLETLPLLVLERICEYLDDDSEKRRNVWAFSETSKCCCAAAAAQRFCQIQLKIASPATELETVLGRWTEMLNPGGNHGRVRRLKVLGVETKKETPSRRFQGQDTEAENGEGKDQDGEDDDKDDGGDWNASRYLDMHDFCRPSKVSLDGAYLKDDPSAWLPLARFISQLPGLKDLVWACASQLPGSILSAIHAGSCRLHIHRFHLDSLIQPRGSPQPIHQDEYELASSPSLFSLAVPVTPFDSYGSVDYNEEAVMRMAAGTAPNLAHVHVVPFSAGNSIALQEAFGLGKPAWEGFFPGKEREEDPTALGSLQSLVLPQAQHCGIDNWDRYTDTTKLRCLAMSWSTESVVASADTAARGHFESLDTLRLAEIEDETDQAQAALNRFLENLNPLQRLNLSGYLNHEVFHNTIRHHGPSLRNLSVFSYRGYRNEESRKPLLVLSEALIQRLAEQCPNLEQLDIQVKRTAGDHQETAIYRALGRLPRLKRVVLRLSFSVGPDQESWDEETDGRHPLAGCHHPQDIPFAYLREAFVNSAFDATLALSIFNLMSSNNSSLRRDDRGRVTARELDRRATVRAGEEWRYLSEGPNYHGEDIYQEVFQDIWPQETPQWWNDWKSFPLSEVTEE